MELTDTDSIEVRISHIMKKETLHGILDVGFSLERVDWQKAKCFLLFFLKMLIVFQACPFTAPGKPMLNEQAVA